MNIEEFVARHGSCQRKSIDRLSSFWIRARELDSLLHTQMGAGVVLGDLLVGDGILDQISPELRGAFNDLMGEKADTCDKVREILIEKLERGDNSVLGLVNKIKGQVGENRFMEELGDQTTARLADLGNQEAWDVAIEHDWGTQYVQVKMYSDADGVLSHMRDVDFKLASGREILDGETVVNRIDFAVPIDIADEVSRKAEALGLNIGVLPIQTTAQDAADVVMEGVNNVGPKALENFFGEILGIAGTAVALHGVANAFLVYKGAKQRGEAFGDTAENAAITAGGAVAGASMELLLHKVGFIAAGPAGVLVLATSMSTRAILKRLAERTDYVEFLRGENDATRLLAASFSR